MKKLAAVVRHLEDRRWRVLGELHPELRVLVSRVLLDCSGRLTPWCGFRGPEDQARAKAEGNSAAAFGQSPHNFRPALAVDVVLHPHFVQVRGHHQDPETPDLWDDESPEALAAWAALEAAAQRNGLERVTVNGKRDRPHLQLPGWRGLVLPQ